jgi:hypothetical protein
VPEPQYRSALNAAARGLWRGELDLIAFSEAMFVSLDRHLRNAWLEGAAKVDIRPDELTPEEELAIAEQISIHRSRVLALADFISVEGRTWGQIQNRLKMWLNRYQGIHDQAMAMARTDLKLQWLWNPMKEHCQSCRKLHGKVYRTSVWRTLDIYPKSPRLACGGYRCGCRRVLSNLPISRGRRPSI